MGNLNGSRQFGPGQLGPKQLGTGAQLSPPKKWTIRPLESWASVSCCRVVVRSRSQIVKPDALFVVFLDTQVSLAPTHVRWLVSREV